MSAALQRLEPEAWRDLGWLVAVFDDWLLVAEPSTVRELTAFLRSAGSTATAADVIVRLAQLRSLWRHDPQHR